MTTKLDEAERAMTAALGHVARISEEMSARAQPLGDLAYVIPAHYLGALRASLKNWRDAEDARDAATVRALRGEEGTVTP